MIERFGARSKAAMFHWTNKPLMEYLEQFGNKKDIAISALLWLAEKHPETREAMGLEVVFEEE